MPTTTTRTGRRTAAKRIEPEVSHRTHDATGIALLAISLVLFIALWAGNGGLLGDSLAAVFRTLFGSGAWAVPAAVALAGVALLTGRATVGVGRISWGAALIFLGSAAALSRSLDGDYFDPRVVESSGGYVGAVMAWSLSSLLGSGKVIGIVALVAIGIVLCLDAPVKSLYLAVRERLPGRGKAQPKQRTVSKLTKKQRGKAVVEMAEPPEQDEPEEATKTEKAGGQITLDLEGAGASGEFVLPPTSLLAEPASGTKRTPKDIQENIETLEATLEQFGIDASVSDVTTGPTITRYEIQLGPGIRVSKITGLADNIAMNLAASHVRVEAPIPGKNAIGVEVPTSVRRIVSLREMAESLEFHDNKSPLKVALGKDVGGNGVYMDLNHMPHLLIGGSTNSGKSICLMSIIMSLILRNSPKELRLVMIDPKRVELTVFEGLPHLMCPVVKDVKEAPGVLRAVWREMDRRYDKFSAMGVRNIDGWNSKVGPDERMPYIVVLVDELADLMIQAANEVETTICRLAQLARATGIHLVIATQRPSVDVITGTIKANISSRIAFSMSSQIDSRTIIDQPGAEKLIGRGDMLFLPIDATKPVRVQGCFVTEKETAGVCTFWRDQAKPEYVLTPIKIAIEEKEGRMRDEEDEDPLWEEGVRWVVDRGQASTSMLQRKFSIGFQRASRLLDMMEERNIVGERDGPRPREVLMDVVQVETLFGGPEVLTPVPEGEYIDEA
ncbi:MAG: DNA translocase FtsK 4TM domain-containing protein [Armatimonadetes bacterium]|nr:DNA translocase FtsK 4TM domain-containing protein [Armatimonadota bacterium]